MVNDSEVIAKIKSIANELYPWAKENVTNAETFGGFEAKDIWMRGIRNGLDHFAIGIRYYYASDYDKAMKSLNDSERQFQMAAHEGWLRCSAFMCRKLEDILDSPSVSGSIDLAFIKLKSAKTLMSQSRLDYTDNRTESTEKAKKSAETAEEGLRLVSRESIYASLTFWVGIVALIVTILAILFFR